MAVGRTLIIPTIGFLNISRPAFTLKRIINKEGIKTLRIVFRASVHPTRYTHQIEAIPEKYKIKYVMASYLPSKSIFIISDILRASFTLCVACLTDVKTKSDK